MIISLAPMIRVTTPNFRKLIRIISPDIVLFTEMICCNIILNNPKFWNRIGEYDSNTIIQLGGSDPDLISKAIKLIISESKFRKFNLNVGCPSKKVLFGEFGAILMLKTDLVCSIINTVYKETGIIMSIKCRIGVDSNDSFDFFETFIKNISENTKCKIFYIHARKCWLKGLSPKENRNIPKLKYDYVRRIKKKYPHLEIHLNGSVSSFSDGKEVDGIMIGRAAMGNIFVFEELKKYRKILTDNERREIYSKNISIDEEFNENIFRDEERKENYLKNIYDTEKNEKQENILNDEERNENYDKINFLKKIEFFENFNSNDNLSDQMNKLKLNPEFSNLEKRFDENKNKIENKNLNYRYDIMKKYLKKFDQNYPLKHENFNLLMLVFKGTKKSKIFKSILIEISNQRNLIVKNFIKKFNEILIERKLFDYVIK